MSENGHYPERVYDEEENGFYFVDPETKEPISDQVFLHAGDFINGFAAVEPDQGFGWYHIGTDAKPAYPVRNGEKRFTGVGDFTHNKKGRLTTEVIRNGIRYRINTDGKAVPGTARKWTT